MPEGIQLPEKKGITTEGFQIAANLYLESTVVLDKMLEGMKFNTDAKGNLKPETIDSIMTMLNTAIKMTDDEIAKRKFQNMLNFMKDYLEL